MRAEVRLIFQLLIGIVFLFSTIGKLLAPRKFSQAIRQYVTLPGYLSYLVAWILISMEAFIAGSHLTGWFLAEGILVALAVLICFGIAISSNLSRGRVLPCYCFGWLSREVISGRTLVRLFLLFVAEFVLLLDLGLFRPGYRNLGTPHYTLLSFSCAVLLLLSVSWLLNLNDVLVSLRPLFLRATKVCRTRLKPIFHNWAISSNQVQMRGGTHAG